MGHNKTVSVAKENLKQNWYGQWINQLEKYLERNLIYHSVHPKLCISNHHFKECAAGELNWFLQVLLLCILIRCEILVTILIGAIHATKWYTITDRQRHLKENMSKSAVSTLPANHITLWEAGKSAGKVMTKSMFLVNVIYTHTIRFKLKSGKVLLHASVFIITFMIMELHVLVQPWIDSKFIF